MVAHLVMPGIQCEDGAEQDVVLLLITLAFLELPDLTQTVLRPIQYRSQLLSIVLLRKKALEAFVVAAHFIQEWPDIRERFACLYLVSFHFFPLNSLLHVRLRFVFQLSYF